MKCRFLFALLSLLFFSNLKAQWRGMLYTEAEEITFWETLQYISENEAFLATSTNKLFSTTNNWDTHELLDINVPNGHKIVYLKKYGRSKFLIVAQNVLNPSGTHSGVVMISENGGFKWETVFTMPPMIERFHINTGTEHVFVRNKGDKIAILYADVLCVGNIDGKNWKWERTKWYRSDVNQDFFYINDTCFAIMNQEAENRIKINNQWSQCSRNSLALGNGYQVVDQDSILEYNFENQGWKKIGGRFALNTKGVKQLSNRYAVIFYYDWRVSKEQYVLFDYEKKDFIELFSSDTLYNSKLICSFDDGFVVIPENGNAIISRDLGKTWNPFSLGKNKGYFGSGPMLVCNKDIQMYMSRGGALVYSRDSGKIWKAGDLTTLKEKAQGEFGAPPILSFSYANDAEIYIIMEHQLYKVVPMADSFELIESPLNSLKKQILEVFHSFDNEIYLLSLDSFKRTSEGERFYFALHTYKDQELQRLHSFSSIPHNGWLYNKMIKNEKYLVISVGSLRYVLDLKTNELVELPSNSYNPTSVMEFISDSVIYVSGFSFLDEYNLSTKKRTTRDFFINPQDYMSCVAKSDSEYHVLRYWALEMVTRDMVSTLDSTFLFNDFLSSGRNWNNQTWICGGANLYSNTLKRDKNLPKDNCIMSVDVYPNPSTGVFNLFYRTEGGQILTYEVFNSLGQLVHKSEENKSIGIYESKFDLSALNSGIYYVKVTTNCDSELTKVIKSNEN